MFEVVKRAVFANIGREENDTDSILLHGRSDKLFIKANQSRYFMLVKLKGQFRWLK